MSNEAADQTRQNQLQRHYRVLREMFSGSVEHDVIKMVLQRHPDDVEACVTALLEMAHDPHNDELELRRQQSFIDEITPPSYEEALRESDKSPAAVASSPRRCIKPDRPPSYDNRNLVDKSWNPKILGDLPESFLRISGDCATSTQPNPLSLSSQTPRRSSMFCAPPPLCPPPPHPDVPSAADDDATLHLETLLHDQSFLRMLQTDGDFQFALNLDAELNGAASNSSNFPNCSNTNIDFAAWHRSNNSGEDDDVTITPVASGDTAPPCKTASRYSLSKLGSSSKKRFLDLAKFFTTSQQKAARRYSTNSNVFNSRKYESLE